MPKSTIKQADKLRELTAYSKYYKLLKRATDAAKNGKSVIQVIKAETDGDTLERLDLEGFTVDYVNYQSYEAYKISW